MKRASAVIDMMFWMNNPEWYTYDKSKGIDGYKIRPDAPEEAKKSFEAWYKQKDN